MAVLSCRLRVQDLTTKLVEIETPPWSEWNHGKPITPVGLSRLLKPFDIISRNIRVDDRILKGYLRTSFDDAWARYLPAVALATDFDPLHQPRCSNGAGKTQFFDPPQDAGVAGEKSEESSIRTRLVAHVAAESHPQAPQGDYLLSGKNAWAVFSLSRSSTDCCIAWSMSPGEPCCCLASASVADSPRSSA